MSLKLIANWKLNGSFAFNQEWTKEFLQHYQSGNYSSIGIAPASLYLKDIQALVSDYGIIIGAQNIDCEDSGARTGEISASMLKDAACKFCLVGHSERRILFHESNEIINQKINQAAKNFISPVLCIGESSEQNKQNQTEKILKQQIEEALQDSSKVNPLIIAYEPVWAIGSGITPQPHKINSIHEMIKDVVQSRFPHICLEAVLYGGSVNLENAALLFQQQEIDGALIGGASLDGKEFALIGNILNELKV